MPTTSLARSGIIGRNTTPLTRAKMAELTPIPSANVTIASKVIRAICKAAAPRIENHSSGFVICGCRFHSGSQSVLHDLAIKQMHCAFSVAGETSSCVTMQIVAPPTCSSFSRSITASPFRESRFPVVRRQAESLVTGKRAGNGYALLLSAGELTGQVFSPMRHAHALKRLNDSSFTLKSRSIRGMSVATRRFHIL